MPSLLLLPYRLAFCLEIHLGLACRPANIVLPNLLVTLFEKLQSGWGDCRRSLCCWVLVLFLSCAVNLGNIYVSAFACYATGLGAKKIGSCVPSVAGVASMGSWRGHRHSGARVSPVQQYLYTLGCSSGLLKELLVSLPSICLILYCSNSSTERSSPRRIAVPSGDKDSL